MLLSNVANYRSKHIHNFFVITHKPVGLNHKLKHSIAHSLNHKVIELSNLLRADSVTFGRLDGRPGYFLDLEGLNTVTIKNKKESKYYKEFATPRSFHAYLDNKIKLLKDK
jgi:hypothetical protein